MKKLVMALGLVVALAFAGNASAIGGRSVSSVRTRTVSRQPIVNQRIVTSHIVAAPIVTQQLVTQQVIAQPVYTQAIVAQPAAIVNGCHVGGVSNLSVQRVRVR